MFPTHPQIALMLSMELRMTVGNNSAVNRMIVAYAADDTNFPTIAKATMSQWSAGNGKDEDIIEPRHAKTNKMSVRPAKTQISLGIRPSADAQADLSLRWALTHFVGFVMSRLI